ncbi:type II toxin-antitoxin system ParD family antitoxin [Asticcacaulis sp. ZE23SCel15]|jgi:antitoxin ParD1/3/4|uniref:ribbon-helix-helix domain-containing protein n=1 Tax=Asticcacaulis sp. ZE23SCel15 TaxID=3059027 RepID=UPI00265E1ABA|nr:type II toxin-antitoxin system ParD family antitoxin [Asticcacaulis sp. ZE23SCel15]WKL58721.1 type II toxin-antitoxin system ParD family antitoxin [Asticcacaulis sp. ZE23SCel15]
MVDKISIALPSDMLVAIKSAVASGEYSTTSEVIREALRDWKLKRRVNELESDELRQLIRQGLESPTVSAEDVFSRLKSKYSALIESHASTDAE